MRAVTFAGVDRPAQIAVFRSVARPFDVTSAIEDGWRGREFLALKQVLIPSLSI